MASTTVHLASLDGVADRVIDHLKQGHDAALVGSPGCGMSAFVANLTALISAAGFEALYFDVRANELADLVRQVGSLRPGANPRRVIVLDHLTDLLFDDYKRCLQIVSLKTGETDDLCLWCGPLDARNADRNLGVKLCSVPSAHVSFPVLPRDELLSAYRAIAAAHGCRWGDAILYLLLDFCGGDLRLVEGATDYLHGDWSDRLYDESVWDRIREWLANDEAITGYCTRLNDLPPSCAAVLALVRFGGKPRCLRAEVIEEVDDALRRLCLTGFLIPNLLPGFYQLRNLAVRFLLDASIRPDLLFRRATNERAAQLLQDAETMFRQVLTAAFQRIGSERARELLEKIQQPGEVIDKELNRALLKWAKEHYSEEASKSLNDLLLEHRNAFKKSNSVWATVNQMMKEENVEDDASPHIQCIEYLTFNQLGGLVLDLTDEVFPQLPDDLAKKRLRDAWQEGVAKVRRLRNQVAHLRNVGFQDMEDLTGTLERMRRDIIDFGGWK